LQQRQYIISVSVSNKGGECAPILATL